MRSVALGNCARLVKQMMIEDPLVPRSEQLSMADGLLRSLCARSGSVSIPSPGTRSHVSLGVALLRTLSTACGGVAANSSATRYRGINENNGLFERIRNPPSQSWTMFLKNDHEAIAAIDFFTVPTAIFRILYVFIAIEHAHHRTRWAGRRYRVTGARWAASSLRATCGLKAISFFWD